MFGFNDEDLSCKDEDLSGRNSSNEEKRSGTNQGFKNTLDAKERSEIKTLSTISIMIIIIGIIIYSPEIYNNLKGVHNIDEFFIFGGILLIPFIIIMSCIIAGLWLIYSFYAYVRRMVHRIKNDLNKM